MRRRLLTVLTALIGVFVVAIPSAWAASPHFIKSSITVSVSGNTLTVSGKEAGLGDITQVDISLTATAVCVNGGGNHPRATNKMSVASDGTFDVHNGRANFTLTATATFQPDCSPPMTVVFRNIVLTDTTNGVTYRVR